MAPRGAAFPLVIAIEAARETLDDDTVVAMFAEAFFLYAERIIGVHTTGHGLAFHMSAA